MLRYTEIGTAHAFQGREFDVVVFDMVEAGTSWVAKGDLAGTDYAQSGLRLFNVAATRARRRLYLVANGAAVRRARQGPLADIAAMIDAGSIMAVRAADLLDLPDHPDDGSVSHDLWDACAPPRNVTCRSGSWCSPTSGSAPARPATAGSFEMS